MAMLSQSTVVAYNYLHVSIKHQFLAYMNTVWPTIALLF